MNIKPIRNDDDLRLAFQRLEKVYQAQEGTPQADEMEILVTLIEAHENKYFQIDQESMPLQNSCLILDEID
jgi:HTH-type transcriptional regulator/antitoxin HigA